MTGERNMRYIIDKKLLLSTLLFGFPLLTNAGVTLQSGEVYEWQFTLEQGGDPFTLVDFGGANRLGSGDSLQLEFYEHSILDDPLMVQWVSGTTTGLSGYFFLDFASKGFFQNGNGVFAIRMLNRTVELDRLYVASNIDGVNYFASHVPIPEPRSAALALSLIAFGGVLVYRRRARSQTHRS